MDADTARRRVESARVGHLGTVTSSGLPHLVPCCFVVDADHIYSAIDGKPKSTLALRRLANLRANAAASLLVDHYEEDWSALWWVRIDGRGRVADDEAERERALRLLGAKYDQYRRMPPPGPVIALDPQRWSWWEATTS
jgi:PPOX class probable F420-dependent enzyme